MDGNQAAGLTAPSHVPPELVFDFDFLHDPRLAGDLHEGIVGLLAEAPPLFYTPRNGGHWVALRHEMVFEIARDYERFSNEPQSEDRAQLTRRVPITYDPPEHTTYRHVLVQAFAPKSVNALQEDIRALAVELIDAVAGQGACDFVNAVSEPLPVKIFMKLMGLPLERFTEFREWVVLATGAYESDKRQEVFDKVLGMTGPLVRERMRTRRNDLISRVIDADLAGRKPTFEEVQGFCLMMFIAGLDTVVNAMSFGVRGLAVDQALQARLRADPSLIGKAVEELHRRRAITVPGRQLKVDTEFHGAPMRRGDKVLLMLPGANLDERAFANPTELDLERTEPHIGFGAGPHRCVGSHLARIELRIMYEELLKRIPTFRLDPRRPWTFHGASVFAVETLPIIWDLKT